MCRARRGARTTPAPPTPRRDPRLRSSAAEVLLDDGLRLVLAPAADEPPRRLRRALPQEERPEGRDRARRQDQAPVDPEAVERVGDDDRQQESAIPRRLQARQPPSP